MSESLADHIDSSTAEATPEAGHNAAPEGEASPNGVEVNKTPDQANWFLAENLPGEGDKPDWLIDKFKTASDQAKAYRDLEKKLGAFKGAPEEYDLTLEGDEFKNAKFDPANPVLQEFLADAKAQGVSQEYVTNMLKSYAKLQAISQPDMSKEMEKLGVNGQQDLKILLQWGSNNFSKEELGTFKSMFRTAEQVRLFDKIRQLSTKANTQPNNTRTPVESADKIKQMIHDPRYSSDPTFREEVRSKLAQVIGEKPLA